MRACSRRFSLSALAALTVGAAVVLAPATLARGEEQIDRQGIEFFEKQIRPLFVKRCYECHSTESKELRGGLRLDSRAGWSEGGDSGPAVVPGDPDASPLVRAVRYEDYEMPPSGRLPEEEVALLVEWIKRGAPDPRDEAPDRTAKGDQPTAIDLEAARDFWSFRPLADVVPPAVADEAWCRTPIDRFILARLEAAELQHAAPIQPHKLIRRLYFDLVGLPPAPEEVDAFVADPSPAAYEALVDRLLASPQYGERWGRYWLDLARFGESHGFEHDTDRPTAYHYRDFVIEALNQDLPYDQFIHWQLAGDELAPENLLAMKATGFLAAGVHSTQITKNQAEKERYDELDDMLSTTFLSTLGLTVGCARCHDHKFDPIPTEDYYRLLSTFTTTVRSEPDLMVDPDGFRADQEAFQQEHAPYVEALARYERDDLPLRLAAWERGWPAIRVALVRLAVDPSAVNAAVAAALDRAAAERSVEEQAALAAWFAPWDAGWRELKHAADEHAMNAPQPETVKVLISSENVPAVRLHTQGPDFYDETFLLKRGDPALKERVVEQGFLRVLTRADDGPAHWRVEPSGDTTTSLRRTALAHWLTDVELGAGHLAARVAANRLWTGHFGRGLVATPSDFGTQGTPPSHPELLDWLARELVASGWRLKPLHKQLVMSAVYQQGDAFDEAAAAADPQNALWWRREPRRLEAEAVRDALLAVSGTLDSTMYGPGTLDQSSHRRSIYFTIKRSELVPFMQLFDAPDALQSTPARVTTTIAPQALLMMNSPLVRDYARGLADRAAPTDDVAPAEAVTAAFRLAFSRSPDDVELARAVDYIAAREAAAASNTAAEGDSAPTSTARREALVDFCHALVCLNEFVYVE